MNWQYLLRDDNRCSYAGFLKSPLTPQQCTSFFDAARSCTDWQQPSGPQGPIPRKTAWMVQGNCSCVYRYGSVQVQPQPYPPWMIELLKVTMPCAGLNDPAQWPNCCNLNLYDDGGMSVGWHSDDEQLFQGKFMDIRIISLSFGVRRKFEMRANWPEPREKPVHILSLGDGDMCTMEGMMQKHYQHRVPKEGNVKGARINLTWRWVVKHNPRCPSDRTRLA